MIHFFDVQKMQAVQQAQVQQLTNNIASTASFLVIAFFLLLFVLSTHQDWEPKTHDERGQLIWLGGVCNLIGILMFGAFVMLVKGI